MEKDQFSFALPYAYNKRICITDAEKGDVESVVIVRILFRICTHKAYESIELFP